jgi:FdhD protein
MRTFKKSPFGVSIRAIKVKKDFPDKNFSDVIPLEILLNIYLNGNNIATISCSPGNLTELAVGYLINSGFISGYSDINLLRLCGQEVSEAVKKKDHVLKIEVSVNPDKLPSGRIAGETKQYVSSACGSLDRFFLRTDLRKIKDGAIFDSSAIFNLNPLALASQNEKKQIGGLHNAAMFGPDSRLMYMAEDIGRHNCIDKIAGFMSINKLDPSNKIVFTTGRISLDVVYKAMVMAIPVFVSNSSVTYSAAMLGKKIGLTLIGYARGQMYNI